MKTQIGILLVFLSLFVVPSPPTEAAVTTGKVQYYYESSTDPSDSSTSSASFTSAESSTRSTTSTQSSTPRSTSNSATEAENPKRFPTSPSSQKGSKYSGNTRFLQTNDQQNIFLIFIGLLILAIAFLGWRIVKNRRKN